MKHLGDITKINGAEAGICPSGSAPSAGRAATRNLTAAAFVGSA